MSIYERSLPYPLVPSYPILWNVHPSKPLETGVSDSPQSISQGEGYTCTYSWRMAVIENLIKGNDRYVWAAEVRTSNGRKILTNR